MKTLARLVFWGLIASSAGGANLTYYVDQRHPRAADANAGTNEGAPLKTIQAAMDKAGEADTVLIKKGVYRETVAIRNSGVLAASAPFENAVKWSRWLVLSAYGDDEAIIDGSDEVPASAWQPVEGEAGVYVATVETPPGPAAVRPPRGVTSVYWKGERLTPCLRKSGEAWQRGVPGRADVCSWHYDPRATNLYVNLGGADPRDEKTGAVEAAVRAFGIVGLRHRQDCVVVRKLTVRRTAWRAISMPGGSHSIVEDCHVYDSEHGIKSGSTQSPIVRRCVVHDICSRALELGGNQGGRFYDNVVYAFGQDWFRERDTFMPWAFILFCAEFGRYFHNVVLQPYEHQSRYRGGGFWPDAHSPSHWFVGNAVYQAGTGFYIESPAQGNIARWNTACKGSFGIVLAANALNEVVENYLAYNDIGCGLQGTEFSWVWHNVFGQNWLKGNAIGIRAGPEPGANEQTRNYAQRNVYEPRVGGRIARWAVADFTNLTAFSRATGQDTLGREASIRSEEPGLVWVRVDGTDAGHEVIPLFGNPDCARLTCLFDAQPFFWTRGVESGKDTYPGWWQYTTDDRVGDVFPGLMVGYRPWCEASPGGVSAWLDGVAVSNTLVGGRHLATAALPSHGFGTNGVGWWSPSLPAAGGATVDVGLWMKLEDVRPSPSSRSASRAGGCGAVVYVEWSNWTGQDKSRGYVVGGEIGSPPLHPELTTGTKGWTEVKGSVTAPEGARRMALFLGARGCTGTVRFDEIRTLAARPGQPIRRIQAGAKPDGQPLADPATLEFFEVSLTNLANRALWGELASGKEGWRDCGSPGWDLRNVGVGKKVYGGVPFAVSGPLSCVVLDPYYRPEGKLPKAVEIPVGRKADVLYFLHTSAWMLGRTDGGHSASYYVMYENGYERIFVDPGVNVRDWGATKGAAMLTNGPTMRATTPFEMKNGVPTPVAGITCLEWINPYTDRLIKDIRFAGADGVPILLAVTGGVREK